MKLHFLILFSVSIVLTGCFHYDDVVYQGIENIKISRPNEGKMTINFNIKLDNPNKYRIKIKPSDLTVFLGGKELGEIHLTETLVIDKRSMKSYPMSIDVKVKDLAKSGLGGLIELATKQTVTLRFKGFVRGSVYGITQKRYVDQTKEIETGEFLRLLGL
jgi:LEA14-like dessication related protein